MGQGLVLEQHRGCLAMPECRGPEVEVDSRHRKVGGIRFQGWHPLLR